MAQACGGARYDNRPYSALSRCRSSAVWSRRDGHGRFGSFCPDHAQEMAEVRAAHFTAQWFGQGDAAQEALAERVITACGAVDGPASYRALGATLGIAHNSSSLRRAAALAVGDGRLRVERDGGSSSSNPGSARRIDLSTESISELGLRTRNLFNLELFKA